MVSNSSSSPASHLIQLIRKNPHVIFYASGTFNRTPPVFAGKYQDSESEKVAQQDINLTMSKIDKETFDRLHEESRRLKFENESTARDLSSTKNQLV
jgi:hypothetical protein